MFYASNTEYNEGHCGGYVSYLKPLLPFVAAFGNQCAGSAVMCSLSQFKKLSCPDNAENKLFFCIHRQG